MRDMYGEEAAQNYLESLQPELNKRLAGSEEQLARAYAESNPLLSNLKTVATAPIRGMGALEMGVERLFGKEPDLYDPRLNLTREAEAIREETAGSMGSVGGFLYNTGMSMVDNIANMALWGGLGKNGALTSLRRKHGKKSNRKRSEKRQKIQWDLTASDFPSITVRNW